jgi:anti-sigma B factor antagonist
LSQQPRRGRCGGGSLSRERENISDCAGPASGADDRAVGAAALRDALVNGLGDGGTFVVDMTGVTFLGSAGLAVLVEAARLAQQSNAALKVVATARAVTRPLEATGLGEVFSVSDSVDAALS